MALHGHTKIELHNVKTGETQVVEEKNMLTNWIRDICSCNPMTLGANSSSLSPETLFGGVGLYGESMNENADDYFQHLNKEMVGHASISNATISTDDLTYGVYNTNMSDTSGRYTKKFVWDWDMEHGNGTIASLGLLTSLAGLSGTGSPKLNINATKNTSILSRPSAFNMYKDHKLIGESWSAFDKVIYFSFEHGFACWISTLKNLYYKVTVPTKKINPFDMGYNTYRGSDETTRKTVQLPVNSNLMAVDGRYIYMPANCFSPGSSGVIYKHDMVTETTEEIPFTNTSGETIYSSGDSSGNYTTGKPFFFYAVSNGYFYFATTAKHIFAINLSNNTDVHQIMLPDGNPVTLTEVGNYYRPFGAKMGDNPVFTSRGGYSMSNSDVMIINTTDFIARYLNMDCKSYTGITTNSSFANSCNCDIKYIHISQLDGTGYTDNNGWVNLGFHYPYLPLVTINNLESPVTKTADMTMRITYTISLEEEEE